MPRPDGRIEPGQPIRGAISARAWNRAQDAADLVLGANPGTLGAPGSTVLKPYTWCYCQPSVTVARWGVLEITGVAITPASSSGGATASFEEMPVLTGGTPSVTTTAWCVAVEPIESGKVGRVAVGGVVQLKAADLGKASGAHVLWKDSNWALIRIHAGVIRGTFAAPWEKDATATVTDSVISGATYTAKNYMATIKGTGNKHCLITYASGEWILIEAERVSVIRGTFTAPWNKGETATVTDAVAPIETYTAKNYLSSFTGPGTLSCEIAHDGQEWVLVSAETIQQDVITGVTLGSSGLEFTKETIYISGKKTPPPAKVTISTTACT